MKRKFFKIIAGIFILTNLGMAEYKKKIMQFIIEMVKIRI